MITVEAAKLWDSQEPISMTEAEFEAFEKAVENLNASAHVVLDIERAYSKCDEAEARRQLQVFADKYKAAVGHLNIFFGRLDNGTGTRFSSVEVAKEFYRIIEALTTNAQTAEMMSKGEL